MYAIGGGCSTLFHLAAQWPKVIAVMGLSLFASQVSVGLPGEQTASQVALRNAEKKIVEKLPNLPTQVEEMKKQIDLIDPQPTEEQVRTVLEIVAPCTDMTVKDVLFNPDERREAAWLFYLDTYSRWGPGKAESVFQGYSPPQRK